jgi:hypothetical protein
VEILRRHHSARTKLLNKAKVKLNPVSSQRKLIWNRGQRGMDVPSDMPHKAVI